LGNETKSNDYGHLGVLIYRSIFLTQQLKPTYIKQQQSVRWIVK
jgi:hypothetical protein